ncbi:hypothetical protein H3C65_04290 [Patescibacteria group bacterium]|nr:hypothetical protein [Patescibacteria group bacterium]
MLKVYFTASASHNGELIPNYKKIFDFIKKQSISIVFGTQVTDKKLLEKDKKLSANQIFQREQYYINEADIVIAEVSKPSLGVGSEIVYALSLDKPTLTLVMSGYEDKISPMVAGNPSENLFIEYYKNDSYKKIIANFIKNIKKLIKQKNLLRKSKGKLIVIDGGDGSGKTTQAKLLMDHLKKENLPVRYYDFPQYYSSFHGKTVARFLRGEFGAIDDVSPYLASLSYALDRATVKKEMDHFLKIGGHIICNRYATSSMAHQGAKYKDPKERREFLKWLTELEYKVHKMPKENIVIYLYVPWKIGMTLTSTKTDRRYLKGQKQDIAEKDVSHRIASEQMYLNLASKNRHWVKIDCVVGGRLLSEEAIHKKIVEILKTKGYL